MYQILIQNSDYAIQETTTDMKGVNRAIKVFEKNYGKAKLIQIHLLNDESEE